MYDPDAIKSVSVTCKHCGHVHIIQAKFGDLLKYYLHNEPIQKALPYLSTESRELLMTQICPACWDKMFKEND